MLMLSGERTNAMRPSRGGRLIVTPLAAKPAQNALNDLRGFGIVPDAVVVRTDDPAPANVARKISLYGGVSEESVLLMPNADTVYEVPLTIATSSLNGQLEKFTDNYTPADLSKWQYLVSKDVAHPNKTVTIGLVAKYMDNEDTYISVTEALQSAAWAEDVSLDLKWIDASQAADDDFRGLDAIVVPGGFGGRGVEGKIAAARFALDNNVPYLGLCLGLQLAVVAAARRSGLDDANSTEFNPETTHNVVYIMDGQEGKESTGGTLRLGDYTANLVAGSKVAQVYGSDTSVERHRHRYEVNQLFLDDVQRGGLVVSGWSPDGKLVEYVEAPESTYFVATQAHPEFKSRPDRAHPLFKGLIHAAKLDK